MGKEVFDTFFVIHGAPLVLIDDTLPARNFLKSWREKILPEKPKFILVISGHWETDEPSINVVDFHETIHDFEDFPPEMYQVIRSNFDYPINSPATYIWLYHLFSRTKFTLLVWISIFGSYQGIYHYGNPFEIYICMALPKNQITNEASDSVIYNNNNNNI